MSKVVDTKQECPVFYHGTRRGFGKGGYLFPRSFHDGVGTSAPATRTLEGNDRWVYVTTSRLLAWVYAWHAYGRGRPKVLVVDPHGDLQPDPEHSPRMQAYRCKGAKVLKVLTEPEVTEEEARSGWVV